MFFKNITKKRDVKERIFRTTQETFVIELLANIVQDLKKLTSSTTVVHIHLHIHPLFAHTNSLHPRFDSSGAIVYYIVQYINFYAHVSKLKVFWLQRMRTRPPLSLFVRNETVLLLLLPS